MNQQNPCGRWAKGANNRVHKRQPARTNLCWANLPDDPSGRPRRRLSSVRRWAVPAAAPGGDLGGSEVVPCGDGGGGGGFVRSGLAWGQDKALEVGSSVSMYRVDFKSPCGTT